MSFEIPANQNLILALTYIILNFIITLANYIASLMDIEIQWYNFSCMIWMNFAGECSLMYFSKEYISIPFCL